MTSYDVICRNIDRLLVMARKRLKKAFDCESQNLHQAVSEDIHAAVESTRGMFACMPSVVYKSLRVIAGRATGKNEAARPDTLWRAASRGAYADA